MRIASCLANLKGLAIAGMLIQFACGGNGSSSGSSTLTATPATPVVSVTLVGVPTDVNAGVVVPVTAQVQGATNTAVTWTVDGTQNGSSDVGTIAGSGNAVTYTAPATDGSHLLAAISVADPTKSANAHVNVHQVTNTAAVALSPAGATVNSGATVNYYASVSGSESQTVSWLVDGVANGSAAVGVVAPGSDGAHVLYTAPTVGGTHTVKAVATNTAGASASGSTTVTVTGTIAPIVAPSITTQPQSVAVNAGQTATFTVVAAGTATLTYQWSRNGAAISGATSASYTTPATSTADSAATFTVVVTNAAGSVKSNAATLTVNAVSGVQTGVVGFGYATTGGAGQSTVHVTNLNDTGAGSFRAAAGSNRIIVFDVGGTIDVQSNEIYFNSCSNVTIDGSNAPSPGITFINKGIWFHGCNNIIVKNIRHRGGDIRNCTPPDTYDDCDPIQFENCSNVVLDHLSISGATDEALDIYTSNYNFTVQNCLIGPGPYPTDSGHNYASTIGKWVYNVSFYHNLISGGSYRNPAWYWDPDAEAATSPYTTGDQVNNVIWKYQLYGTSVFCGAKVNITGNYFYADPSYGYSGASGRAIDIENGSGGAVSSGYSSGNYSKDGSGLSGNVSSPLSVPAAAQITATDATTAANYVKANCGCRVGGLDAFDQALINDLNY